MSKTQEEFNFVKKNVSYKHMPNFILDKRNIANIERRDRILKSEKEDEKLRHTLY